MTVKEPRPVVAPPALDWLNGDVALLRSVYEAQNAKPVPAGAAWIDVEADSRRIKVLAHKASAPGKAAVVYFHGGGFIVGSPLTHADITDALCRESGLPLYSVDYRLAPDFVAPAPIEDGLAVVGSLVGQGAGRIILCGDSAGGAIALAVEARLPQRLRPYVTGVCSIYGAHGRLDSASLMARGSRADGTDAACVARYFTLANGGGRNAYSIAAIARPSPAQVYLMAAAEDGLLDDTVDMSFALRSLGRSVITDVVAGETHGFLHKAGTSASASDAIRRLGGWLSACAES